MRDINKLLRRIKKFRDERDWMQFHNPKDLAAAISIEAAELLQLFLWKKNAEIADCTREKRQQIGEEIADIAIYLLELADNLQIDLAGAIENKLRVNAKRYPAVKAKGKALKYTEL
jgi:NTP pyrophosphatase (non-canonical NTP hydrolase)